MSTVPVEKPEIDYTALGRELDRVKSEVFLGKTAAFLGSIMCSLRFQWDETVGTAGTDGIDLYWDPNFFTRSSRAQNIFVMLHEIWHVAKMHALRRGARDPEIWNQACDHNINLMLKEALGSNGNNYVMDGFPFQICCDDKYKDMAEEDIYDAMMLNPPPPMPPNAMGGDVKELTQEQCQQVINTVVTAVHQARMAGAGNVPGNVEELVEKFLAPVIPWESALQRFFTQLQDEDHTWARPNRRYSDIYLPSRFMDEGRLENLRWYIDVSGSISSDDILRFGSELKFVKETFNPQKLSVVQFDTMIQQVDVWAEEDPFEKIHIIGRGGTSLECVRRDMLEEKPTAAIIFSDLDCSRMQPLDFEIPVIWVVIPSPRSHKPMFGERIDIPR